MTDRGTVADQFFAQAQRFGDHPFLHVPQQTAQVYALDRTDYTYAEVRECVERLVDQYRALNCGPGIRVALALHNRPEFFFHFLALNTLGASIVPLNTAMMDQELKFLISHSESALVVAHLSVQEQLVRIVSSMNDAPTLVTPQALESANPFSAIDKQPLGPNTEAAVIYTSGTTGTPKGCLLSNEYFRFIGHFYAAIGGLCQFIEGRDRLITPLPVSHMNALATSFMGVLETGSCLIQLDRFHPATWWDSVTASEATVMHYLGVMPAMLLNAPETSQDSSFHQVRFAFGAGCDPRHHERFEQRFGIPLTEAWAMSETGAGAWITASHEPRHVGERCFGRLPDGLEVRLVDESGFDVADGETGELLVRRQGEQPRQYFFSGYLKDDQATEEAWQGGWFHTGDEVRRGPDGSFFFVDRRKNIIRRSGENIASIEVESILLRHPQVKGCVVCPVPDDIRGEEVAAMLVSDPGVDRNILVNELFTLCFENLVYYKAPGYFVFVDAIALTASEKVQRGVAKKMAAEEVAAGRALNVISRKKRPRPAAAGQ
ncbi:MAG: AMP-binding protein [Lysobacterales bacterium]